MRKLAAALSMATALWFATFSPGRAGPYFFNGVTCPGPDPHFAYYGCPGLYAGFHGPVDGQPHSYWFHRRHRWTVYTW